MTGTIASEAIVKILRRFALIDPRILVE